MGTFIGQLILDSEIDYDAAKEHLEERIRGFVYCFAHDCYPKEYRESDEWKEKDMSQKLSMALQYSNIDDFIEYLIRD